MKAPRSWSKVMIAQLNSAYLRVLAVCLLPLLSGCATVEKYSLTYRLWDNGEMSKFSEPAPNPNLALFEVTNHADVLVEYDALSEKSSAVHRRSYYLRFNQNRIAAGKKPKWVKPTAADEMKSIRVMSPQAAATNAPRERIPYAVITSEGRHFSLFWPGESKETFDFPVYAESTGAATRLALTPFAVAGDTVMVSAVAAVVGFLVWVQSGAPTR